MRYWIRFAIFNLWIVAALGVLMRYKIGFEFPYFNQKYLQHAHSHFAFVGWITHTLYVLLIRWLEPVLQAGSIKKYQILIFLNLVCAYGMLVSFAVQGYGFFSINLSTYSIFISYFFAYFFFRDLGLVAPAHPAKNWFKAALFFLVISSLGTFYLAYMMASRHFDENLYLASVYFYLHFQYNGWFFFACMGLLSASMYHYQPKLAQPNSIFWAFALSCIPAYLLSILWYKLPPVLYILVLVAALVQVIAWLRCLMFYQKNRLMIPVVFDLISRLFILGITLGLSIKLLLQLGSTIPWVSKLAFGFRAIVIAYLHLVFLVIISFFLITYLYVKNYIPHNTPARLGLLLFGFGVFFNEMLLAVQGLAAFSYTVIPYANQLLLMIALMIWSGLFFVLFAATRGKLS